MQLKNYIKATAHYLTDSNIFRATLPAIDCKSGLGISIQPGETDPNNTYHVISVDREIPELMPYAEFPEFPLETEYSDIPAQILEDLVWLNGGIVSYGHNGQRYPIECAVNGIKLYSLNRIEWTMFNWIKTEFNPKRHKDVLNDLYDVYSGHRAGNSFELASLRMLFPNCTL